MKSITSVFLLLAAGLAASLQAQAPSLPPGKWWHRPEVVRQLSISNEQKSKLDAVFDNNASELIDLRATVEKSSLELRGALDRAQLERSEIQRLGSRVSEARSRLFDRELALLVDMRAVLTDDQWKRFRTFLARAEERREPMQRPGGQPMAPRGRRMPGGRH